MMPIPDFKWYSDNILPNLRPYLERARWFSGKGKEIEDIRLLDYGIIDPDEGLVIALVNIVYKDEQEIYLLPQIVDMKDAKNIREGTVSPSFFSATWQAMFRGHTIKLENGKITGNSEEDRVCLERNMLEIRQISSEQSNTSIVLNNSFVYKSFRKLSLGENPDYAASSYLFRKCNFKWVPEPFGKLMLDTGGVEYDIGTLSRYINNSIDGWEFITKSVKDTLTSFSIGDIELGSRLKNHIEGRIRRLAKITAEMHNCFSLDSDDPGFNPEFVTAMDVERWIESYRSILESTLGLVSGLPAVTIQKEYVEFIRNSYDLFVGCAEVLEELPEEHIYKTRVHGDYHLGQTLISGDNFYIIDFEGEPMRPLEYRSGKFLPMKDVGGMIRSIEYAVDMSSEGFTEEKGMSTLAGELREGLSEIFVSTYFDAYDPLRPYSLGNLEGRTRLLDFFSAEKALYEVGYEIRNRPQYAWIPLRGLARIAAGLQGLE